MQPEQGGNGGAGGDGAGISRNGAWIAVAAGGGGGGGGGASELSPGGSGGTAWTPGEGTTQLPVGRDGQSRSFASGGIAGNSGSPAGGAGGNGGVAAVGGGGGGGGGLNGGGGGEGGDLDGGAGGGGGASLVPQGWTFSGNLVVDHGVGVRYIVDSTPPVTNIGITPDSPNGSNGWYTSSVGVTLSATDKALCVDDPPFPQSFPGKCSGVAETRCVLDPASVPSSFSDLPSTQCPYVASNASVTSDGIHDLHVATADRGGNADALQHVELKIDGTKPTITAAATTEANANGWYKNDVVVHYTCSDAEPGSGLAESCPADETITNEGLGLYATAHTVTDVAGNTSEASALQVNIDKWAPVTSIDVSPSSPNGSNGWYTSDVHVTASSTDPGGVGGSGVDLTQCVLVPGTEVLPIFVTYPPGTCPYAGAGADVTADNRYFFIARTTDKAGNTHSANVGLKVDQTKPTISAAATTAPNANGWYKNDVVVHYTCSDGASGIPAGTCPADETLSGEGAVISSTARTVTDAAGLASEASNVVTVKIDKTPPANSPTITGTSGNDGWYRSDVSVGWNWSDSPSGIDANDCTQAGTTSGEGSSLTVSATCKDLAANEAADSKSFKVDKTLPSVGVTGVTAGAQYLLGAVPTAGCNTADSLSGVGTHATAAVTTSGSNGVGSFTASCSGAVDNAGNPQAAAVSVSYTVVYAFGGFTNPAQKSTLTYKAGVKIPVKFTLTNAGGQPINAAIAKTLGSNLTATLAGQGITPVEAACSQVGSGAQFQCQVGAPRLTSVGPAFPYTITVYENVTGTPVVAPPWTATAVNPETVYFK